MALLKGDDAPGVVLLLPWDAERGAPNPGGPTPVPSWRPFEWSGVALRARPLAPGVLAVTDAPDTVDRLSGALRAELARPLGPHLSVRLPGAALRAFVGARPDGPLAGVEEASAALQVDAAGLALGATVRFAEGTPGAQALAELAALPTPALRWAPPGAAAVIVTRDLPAWWALAGRPAAAAPDAWAQRLLQRLDGELTLGVLGLGAERTPTVLVAVEGGAPDALLAVLDERHPRRPAFRAGGVAVERLGDEADAPGPVLLARHRGALLLTAGKEAEVLLRAVLRGEIELGAQADASLGAALAAALPRSVALVHLDAGAFLRMVGDPRLDAALDDLGARGALSVSIAAEPPGALRARLVLPDAQAEALATLLARLLRSRVLPHPERLLPPGI
ncbi:MAG: hypothetical protein H6704_16125 [Myxococcales bacterium]|nr:hypothetical protein [Myxococcales bacterium]